MNYDPAIRESLLSLGDKDVDLSLLWKGTKCPSLIIRGANSNLLPENIAMQMLQKNKKSALYTVDGAGHAPSLSTPEEISLVKHWLLQTTQNNT
jgi:pimeloyl-ACP methyl ester carboxylesterase